MSARSSKGPVHTLARTLFEKFKADGRPYESVVIHQLLHAALGSVSPEIARKYKIPFHVHRTEDRQYNLYEAMTRAKACLENLNDIQAMGVALEIIEALRESGVGVNQVQLLLDPSYTKADRKKLLRELGKCIALNDHGDRLLPQTATVAIACGILPRKPDTTWLSRFSLAANYPQRGPSELVEFVTGGECYLWVFPPAAHRATAAASRDKFWGENRARAELGMGFSIIRAGQTVPVNPLRPEHAGTYTEYRLLTPSWQWQSQAGTWRLCNIHRSILTDGSPWGRRNNEPGLSDLLPQGLQSLSRIYGCHTCRTLYVDPAASLPGIPTHCQCHVRPGEDVAKRPPLNS